MRPVYATVTLAAMVLAAAVVGAHAGWFSDETPPANAKPLSSIIKAVEDRGYKTITEVEFEDGKWEIEVHQAGGKEAKIHIDPFSAEIVGK
jgi:hypothetical protein